MAASPNTLAFTGTLTGRNMKFQDTLANTLLTLCCSSRTHGEMLHVVNLAAHSRSDQHVMWQTTPHPGSCQSEAV